MICNEQWIGAEEKCQRMTCELVAGFWLLRDPKYPATPGVNRTYHDGNFIRQQHPAPAGVK